MGVRVGQRQRAFSPYPLETYIQLVCPPFDLHSTSVEYSGRNFGVGVRDIQNYQQHCQQQDSNSRTSAALLGTSAAHYTFLSPW